MADEQGAGLKPNPIDFSETVSRMTGEGVQPNPIEFGIEQGRPTAPVRAAFRARLPFEVRNAMGNVPLDTESEVPFHIRLQAALRINPTEKLKYLNEQFNNDFSRFADNGVPIVRTLDPKTGQAKDLLINTEGITMNDLAEFAAMIPEFGGGIGGQKLLAKVPGLRTAKGALTTLRGIVGEAVGSETAGFFKDVVMQHTVPPGEQLKQRGKMALWDVPAGIGIWGLTKTGSKIITPLGHGTGPVQQQLKEGQQVLREAFGESMPMTPGELTQNPLLLRGESTMSRLPGSAGTFRKILQEKQTVFGRILNRLMGFSAGADASTRALAPSAQEVGEEAIGALRQELNALKGSVSQAQANALDEAEREIMDEIAIATKPGRRIHTSTVGKVVRAAAEVGRGKFQQKADELYDKALSLPGGRDRILVAPDLSTEAKRLMSELPPRQVTRTTAEGVEETVMEPMSEFIPAGVLPKLKALADLDPNQQFSLRDLIRMRTEVDNAIKGVEAIPGTKTHELDNIRDLLTDTMNKAADTAPTPQLKTAWKKANDFYAENVGKFKQKDIAPLFRDVEKAGFIDDSKIVENVITGGPERYKRFRDFLGKDSQVFKILKRGIADDLFLSSMKEGATKVDGETFIKKLVEMKKWNPEVFNDMFPASTSVALESLGNALKRAGGDIDASKLWEIIDNPGALRGKPLTRTLRLLAEEQEKLDKVYKVEQLKRIANGTLGETHIDEANFVRVLWKDLTVRDVEKTLGLLSNKPDVLQRLQNKAVEDILFEAQKVASINDPSRLTRGAMFRQPSTSSLERVIGSEDNKRKLQTLLGIDKYNQLDAVAKVLRAGEASEAAFASAGGLQASAQIAGAIKGGILTYIDDWVAQKVVATVITHPALQTFWPVNKGGPWGWFAPENAPGLYSVMFATEPFIEALVDSYGEQEASAIMGALRKSIWTSYDQMRSMISPEDQSRLSPAFQQQVRQADEQAGTTNTPQPQAP